MKTLTTFTTLALLATGWSASAAGVDLTKLPPPADKQGVSYEKDIRPIFEASCVRCHGAERPKANLRLDSLEGALKGSKEGKVIVAGTSEKSPLVIAVARLDPEKAMPPTPRAGRFGARPGGQGGPPPGGAPGANASAPRGDGPPGGPGGGRGGFGPPPKPLTAGQVGLIRAWIDQGVK